MTNKMITISAAALALCGLGTQAYALTGAGTEIKNTATVSYELGGVTQASVSGEDTFKVDAKVNLEVAAVTVGGVAVNPNESVTLEFTVTNTGNMTNDYILSANTLGGLNLTDENILVNGVDTDRIDDLKPGDAAVTVQITGKIPATVTQATTLTYALLAEARLSDGNVIPNNTADADVKLTMQYVYADAAGAVPADTANHADHSAKITKTGADYAFIVNSVSLSVTKASSIISDPVAAITGSAPKAIPGAVIEYTITASNADTASGTAESVSVEDTLDTTLVNYDSSSIIVTKNGAAQTVATDYTYNYNAGTGTITVSDLTLAPDDDVVIKFKVTIL